MDILPRQAKDNVPIFSDYLDVRTHTERIKYL